MIGAGIFITPGLVVARLPGAAWALGAWLLGGLLALAGAAVYAELGARLPRAGGDYQYLNAAFGPMWGFLNGWAAFTLTFSASAAALAIAAVEHFVRAVPALSGLHPSGKRLAAAALVVALCGANAAGARVSRRLTTAATAIPIVGVLTLFALGLARHPDRASWPLDPLAAPVESWLVAVGSALLPIYFAYSGWNAAAYLAEEMLEPERALPRALLLGTSLVTLLYLVINVGLLCSVPVADLAGSPAAGTEAARLLLGPTAERALSALIAAAVLGSTNVTLMAGARIFYAMAVDNLAPRPLASVNLRGVPGVAVWSGGIVTALLAATGTFARLVSWATLAILLFSSLAAASLFVLRRRQPLTGTYRCPGYPLVPASYLTVSVAILLASAASEPVSSALGLLVVAAGVPAFFLSRRPGRAT
jgi:APA family basic amino acid/polyamine antiporter